MKTNRKQTRRRVVKKMSAKQHRLAVNLVYQLLDEVGDYMEHGYIPMAGEQALILLQTIAILDNDAKLSMNVAPRRRIPLTKNSKGPKK
jgi:hypothetical protein